MTTPRESGPPRVPDGRRRGSATEVCRAELPHVGNGGGDSGNTGTVYQEGGTGPQARRVRHGAAAENDGGET